MEIILDWAKAKEKVDIGKQLRAGKGNATRASAGSRARGRAPTVERLECVLSTAGPFGLPRSRSPRRPKPEAIGVWLCHHFYKRRRPSAPSIV